MRGPEATARLALSKMAQCRALATGLCAVPVSAPLPAATSMSFHPPHPPIPVPLLPPRLWPLSLPLRSVQLLTGSSSSSLTPAGLKALGSAESLSVSEEAEASTHGTPTLFQVCMFAHIL